MKTDAINRTGVDCRSALLVLFCTASIVSCGNRNSSSNGAPAAPSAPQPNLSERYEALTFPSAAIAKNRIGKEGDVRLHVILPPSYKASPERRYPVVYVFHGHGCDAASLPKAILPLLDEAVLAKASPEYLLVGIDGCNQLGGSFYVNSPATGNWGDMATKEVVKLIEEKYRVIQDRRARGLAGYSMGGFAAWNLALANADRFTGAWAACPGSFDANGLKDAMPTWAGEGMFKVAYGAAFAPDFKKKAPFATIPTFDGTVADNKVVAKWQAGFGDIQGKLERYLAGKARLDGIRFDYGEKDEYGWIPRGTVYTAETMKAAGVPVEIAAWQAGHTATGDMIREGFIPFFAKLFKQP